MNIDFLKQKLLRPTMSSRIVLSEARILDKAICAQPSFNDPRHYPFYYYLGQQIHPKRVLQVGDETGLIAYSFLQKSRPDWFILNGSSVAMQNIRLKGVEPTLVRDLGSLGDVDLVMIFKEDEEMILRRLLEQAWNCLTKGWLLVDGLKFKSVAASFEWLTKIKNKTPLVFNTFYMIGMLEKI